MKVDGNYRAQNVIVDLRVFSGAGEETRTLDILLGKQTLCQLSYTRIRCDLSIALMSVNLQ